MNNLKFNDPGFQGVMIIFLICLLFPSAGGASKPKTISGKTMDTFYHISVISDASDPLLVLKDKIDTQLSMLNTRFSMYSDKSELSEFNRTPEKKRFKPSSDFRSVLMSGRKLYLLTGGAWDGTVKPLVDLWGFGTRNKITKIPDASEVAATLNQCGFDKIILNADGIIKTAPGVSLDLGSIAKGYGVDMVAGLLKNAGYDQFLVEIGGEIYAAGTKSSHAKWKVGISRPDKRFSHQDVYQAVMLEDRALATSGNYRNFITINGQTFSHIIDPVTGFPTRNKVASASVVAKDCTFADGLATALMVMPADKGIALVNTLDDVEALIIIDADEKGLVPVFSQGFQTYLVP